MLGGWMPPEGWPPDKNQLTVVCDACKHDIAMGKANANLILTSRHLYMSYARVKCPLPACGHEFQVFLDATDPFRAKQLVKMALAEGWSYYPITPTHVDVITQYEEAADIKLLKPVELTHRLEQCISVLRWELVNATVQSILDVEVESRLPINWM